MAIKAFWKDRGKLLFLLALGCLWGGVRQELNRLPLLQEKPVRPDKKDS